MKQTIPTILLMFLYVCFAVNKLSAQQNDRIKAEQDTLSNYYVFDYINSLTTRDYLTQLDSLKNYFACDFFTLRMAYTKTPDYSPYGISMGDSLKEIRKRIESNQYKKALQILNNVQKIEFVNILSHLYCGYIYRETGDSIQSEYHYFIYQSLLKSILHSGDGVSPKTAYIVISTKEEYLFLDWFNLNYSSQSLMHQDGFSFDVFSTTDPETGEEFEIYFNIQLPFDVLSKSFE